MFTQYLTRFYARLVANVDGPLLLITCLLMGAGLATVFSATYDTGNRAISQGLNMGLKDVAALRATRGTMRDTLYIRQQKSAHQRALMLHQGYAETGTVAPLKTAAGTIAPVVKTHIGELDAM